ncbi:fumarylacetoacetate hydrolase family protein [Caulobacter sp. RHG1]|uniref:2-keto-4-pentenoate hydratase n=1 Tax=Caulobacter sp. (strain RHG1) TaxID=2545762 RepID=UPI00155210B9|nr:2-keto-4-pentenoate hydratase [Caulobacter sp. RHG1]
MTVSEADSKVFTPAAIAPQFVKARQEGVFVPGYPGDVIPDSMAQGYAVQDIAIDLWPDELVGWKVGLVPPQHRERLGAERLAGCIFKSKVQDAKVGAPNEYRAIEGGFCAVEAEFIIRVGKDAPADKTEWTAEEAAEYVGEVIVGVEIAGSPLATINKLGPPVVSSDFGNNDGQILGQVIPNWRDVAWEDMPVETIINGVSLGKATAATIPGTPLAAFAFLLGLVASRGKPLKAGQIVTTGATTGIHDVVAGDVAKIDFGPYGVIECVAVPAK